VQSSATGHYKRSYPRWVFPSALGPRSDAYGLYPGGDFAPGNAYDGDFARINTFNRVTSSHPKRHPTCNLPCADGNSDEESGHF
jgi:hypothetical protein